MGDPVADKTGLIQVPAGADKFEILVELDSEISSFTGDEQLSLQLGGALGEGDVSGDNFKESVVNLDEIGSAYFYGIDDSNTIWEVNPLRETIVDVNKTGLIGNKGANGIAYDPNYDQLFFFHGEKVDAGDYKLYYWADRTKTGPDSLVSLRLRVLVA